jgi:tRNA modification GTPase
MLGKLSEWSDTIVALATAPGVGALGVIRVSGPRAMEIVNGLFVSKDLAVQAPFTLHVGMLMNGEEMLDEVVVSIYHAPRSYTGEDVIEISCHGSPHVEEKIIAACLQRGARLAKPGEFTQRAFLKGKMDLTQAEAVADLIASHSEAARISALHTMRGGFAEDLKRLREQLLGFSALMELELDFSQEDVEFADRGKFYKLIEETQAVTKDLIESFKYGNVIRNGVQVAIVGRPNAGKSTLLNSLLNEQRAIVSDIAGTTRDTIEEVLVIDGIEFRLIDTAGIRVHTADRIEQLGMDRTREKIEQADIVLEILDAENPYREDLPVDPAKLVRVVNKTDLVSENVSHLHASTERGGLRNTEVEFLYDASRRRDASLHALFPEKDLIFISAKTGQGVNDLKKALVNRVLSGIRHHEGTVVTNARHYDVLKQVASALSDIRTGMDAGLSGDLLTLDIRRALHFLGEITGEITSEEQLSWIFGKFCIGK